MDFKSLGAILQMQDRLAAEWTAKQIPAAILVDDPAPESTGHERPQAAPAAPHGPTRD
jgi:hypothetical protein